MRGSVSLVCMPWHTLSSPSIQLGCLQGVLEAASIPCQSHSFHLAFQDHLCERSADARFGLGDYEEVAVRWENLGVGEWVFAVSPFRREVCAVEERYTELLRRSGMSKQTLAGLRRVRRLVPGFLQRCADEVLAARPSVVGFTVVYSQLWPAAVLARVLKERDPELRIVFGGASCEGPMGPAVLKVFPQVDVVVRGEGEGPLVELMESLRAGVETPRLAGLCFRGPEGIVAIPSEPEGRVDLDALPVPVYDEYFERLARSALVHQVLPQVPFESSRGCWWGAKHHCTFCGLNGLEMRFRSKSPERVAAELDALSARHHVLDFTAVDNIIDMRYFESLLPRLVERGRDQSLFYETKANLSLEQVHALRDAGVRTIQPGIESLSSATLQRMKKGVTACQNIRLLKWCARNGIHVIWNLLYGFPGEDPEEYARMAELVPALAHLQPPDLVRMMVYRFSPYHDQPELHGLRLTGPLPHFSLLYDTDEATRADLAYAFDHVYADGRDPEVYVGPLRERLELWKRDAERNRGALTYRRGPDFLVVTDTRTTTTSTPIRYTLERPGALVYLACEGGATLRALTEQCRNASEPSLDERELQSLLHELVEARLIVEVDEKFLSLAQPRFAEGA